MLKVLHGNCQGLLAVTAIIVRETTSFNQATKQATAAAQVECNSEVRTVRWPASFKVFENEEAGGAANLAQVALGDDEEEVIHCI